MTTQAGPAQAAAAAPEPPTGTGESRDYWALALRDFRRNRLAMTGLAVIGLVVFLAVFCPFLANQRPLYIHTTFPEQFDNSLLVVVERLSLLASDEEIESARLRRSFNQLRLHTARIGFYLAEEEREGYARLLDRLWEAVPAPDDHNPEQAGALIPEFEQLFDAELRAITRYPALRALTTGEVYTLLAFFLICGAVVIRRRLPPLLMTLGGILLLAGAGTIIWKSIYPTIQDTTSYRRMWSAPDFFEQGGRVLLVPVPYGENENIVAEARQPPTFLIPEEERRPDQNWHWLGTDTNGRDVLSRMIYGARVSMLVGIVAVGIYTFIGIVLGALAGYFGGWVDIGLSRLIEVVICFPALMLILAVQAFLAPSLMNIILALALLWWTGVARLQRAEFLRLINQDFVQSVRAIGGSDLRIIFRHILPNGLGPILVLVSFGIAGSILVESGLSFLGFGVPQPMASWGDLLNNGRNDIRGTWWLTVFPGMAIFLTVTCFNLVGEGVRDALDPRREH